MDYTLNELVIRAGIADGRRAAKEAERANQAAGGPQQDRGEQFMEGNEGGAAMTHPVVSVSQLRKTYPGGVEALKGISFDVQEGEIFGMLGPNGAGKTTTIGVLTTTVRPSGGRAWVAGHDVAKEPLAVRHRIGVVFQDSVLDNDFSGLDNLLLHARLWRMPRREAKERIGTLLASMELRERANDGVRTYSGGMRRRLEIARALLARPQVLFLDEPTLGLDPAARHGMWDLIQQLRRQDRVTIVVSTHYLEEAERLCDRVAIIHQGQIAALDSPKALLQSLGEEVLELRVDGNTAVASRAIAGSSGIASEPILMSDTITVALKSSEAAPHLVEAVQRAGFAVESMSVRRSTLDDVFMHLTGRRLTGDEATNGGTQ